MPPTQLRRLAALGGAVLLTGAAIAACQATSQDAADDGAGRAAAPDLSDAADELLAWDALTIQAGFDATPQAIYDYLLRAGGGEQPSMDHARRLSEMELTASFSDPAGNEAELRRTEPGTQLSGGLAVGFGGEDIAGVKSLGNDTFARVNWEAMVRDVFQGDEAEVGQARRFEDEVSALPDSLAVPAAALTGGWVRVDPARYGEFAEVLDEHTAVPRGTAEDVAGALTDAGTLLTPQTQWSFLTSLGSLAAADGLALGAGGEEDGGEVVTARLPAGEAWRVIEPLATLMNAQAERFGMPALVSPLSVDPQAPVTAELLVRNGVLSEIGFDLAQFVPGSADVTQTPRGGGLPLTVSLTAGSALSLQPPRNDAALTPEDLTVALMYLDLNRQERAADPNRPDVPGPVQP